MKKIIKTVDKEKRIIQVTVSDERWYLKEGIDENTKLPIFKGVPSVTWIAGHYPKGIAFYKWLADKGWDEAEAIKSAAGDKGSKVHLAISAVLRNEEVTIESKFLNPSTGSEEELTIEEIECIKSFIDWYEITKPKTIAYDVVIFSDKHNYAGTIDYLCEIEGEVYLIDFKTGQSVWPEYELQVSAYKEPLENGECLINGFDSSKKIHLAILQIGYRRNKNLYKFTEIESKF